VYRAFDHRNVMLDVIALTRELTLCSRNCHVGTLDECAQGTLHILCFRHAGDRPWHGEQRCIPPRDAFLICDADLELYACILVKVVQAREDGL